MNNEVLRVAVVGAGRMGVTRAQAVAQFGAHLLAVCDPDSSAAESLAITFPHCIAVADAAQLPWQALNAVFICTPPFARGPVETLAIQHHVAIFVEKPIAASRESMRPVVRAAQAQGLPSAVGYMNRHRASVRQARQALSHAQILGMCGNWVCGPYDVPWWERDELSGGPVNEQATHLIDLARYLVGDVDEVQALPTESAPFACAINLRFATGAVGSLFYSCGSREKSIRLQVFTTDQPVHLAGWEFDRIEAGQAVDPPLRSRDERNQIFLWEVDQFLRALRGDPAAESLCDLGEAYHTQRLVDAVTAALKTGLPQRLKDYD